MTRRERLERKLEKRQEWADGRDRKAAEASAYGDKSWAAADAHPGAWVACSREHADYCLEVLPPIYFRGGFAVSEAVRHDAEDRAVYLCIASVRGRFFARNLTLEEVPEEARGLRDQLGR